ncbi:M28 family peptidase [Nonomuraea sp. NPDC049758]|uniref:M28 family peptidase n=1 Tax=Nonomuraea sp. NPDC049758 TaxID=3154360 RepID=UPI003436FC40
MPAPRAPGSGPRVLLAAHYDGVADDPGMRLPAAADNAAGVAAVLEAFRVLTADPAAGPTWRWPSWTPRRAELGARPTTRPPCRPTHW